jgi:hypothetical protein
MGKFAAVDHAAGLTTFFSSPAISTFPSTTSSVGVQRSFSHSPGNFSDGRQQHHRDGSERAMEHIELSG